MQPGTIGSYARAILAALPRGRIWPREQGQAIADTAEGLAPSFQRLDARAVALLADAFPGTTYELLPEWEASLGLPDPCAGEGPSIQQRRAQVVARLTASGGQSIPYFTQVASALGYSITIEQFAPARADELSADDPVYDDAWAYAWRVHAPQVTVTEFAADLSAADEPLASWGNDALECTLRRIAPAHTIIQFAYGS